ncbi:MAG: PEGA domain-containing protein [Planctomycetes bacterium]|nr:PEGA domain-containing protein [Planctomycetota bacterium]
MTRDFRSGGARVAVAALLGCPLLLGCVDRRLAITSEPPGATVLLNDAEVGATPCEVEFTYFGTYDVRLHKDGYEPLVTKAEAKAPPHEWPGLDLAAMAVPTTKRTRIEWHFTLTPAVVDDAALMARASELAGRAAEQAPPATPTSASEPPTPKP